MSLPKLNVPTFELTLPSNGKKIRYRPFLVKEHKNLLILKDSDDEQVIRILEEAVDACTFGELNVKSLPSVDLEYTFLNIRAKSIGETIELLVNCDCGNKIDYGMTIPALKIESGEGHTNKIMITDTVGVEMKYPRFKDTMKVFIKGSQEDNFELVLSSVKAIYTTDGEYEEITPDNKAELVEFIESMTKEQFDKIENFFETMPKLVQNIEVTCPKCNTVNRSRLEGLQNFFV